MRSLGPLSFAGRRNLFVAAGAAAALSGALVGLVSCSKGDQSALLAATPKLPMSVVSVAAVATTAPTTTLAPTTTAAATTTEAPTTTTTEAPAPTTTIPAPEPIAPLTAPLEPLGSGAEGDAVAALQQRLFDLGFWLQVDGQYGHVTTQAVMAFQKYYVEFGLDTSGRADQATVDALAAVTVKPFAGALEGDLAVVDKARQVLHFVREGRTLWTLNTSTGTGKRYTETNQKTGEPITDTAITPEGQFSVYREYSSGWESGQLGRLYRPKYFKGGVAVHGSNSIPNFPASHGCVRVSNPAMDWIWANDLLPRGAVVVVHNKASAAAAG